MEQCLMNVGILSARCCGPKGVLCAIADLGADPSLCKRSTKVLGHACRLTEIQKGMSSIEGTLMRWLYSQVQHHCQAHYDGGWLVGYLLSDVSLKLRRITHVSEAMIVHSLDRIVSCLKVLFSVKYRGLCGARKVTIEELPTVAATMLYSIPSNSKKNTLLPFTGVTENTDKCLRRKVSGLIVDACIGTSVDGFMYPQRIHVHVYTPHMVTMRSTCEVGNTTAHIDCSSHTMLPEPSLVNGMILERTFFSPAMHDLILYKMGYPSRVLLLSFSVTDDTSTWELIMNALRQCTQLNYEMHQRQENVSMNGPNCPEKRTHESSCQGVILASQKVIDQSFQQLLLRLGVGVIERLSINSIDAFKLITGATLFDDLTAFNISAGCDSINAGFNPMLHTGVIREISCVSDLSVGAPSSLIIRSITKSSGGGQVSTLLVPSLSTSSPCSLQAEEINVCVHATCRLFASLYVMPGGGAFERFVAHFIGKVGERSTDYCLRAVADIVRSSLLQYSDQVLGVCESRDSDNEYDLFSAFDTVSMTSLNSINPHLSRHVYQAVREIEGIVHSVGLSDNDGVSPVTTTNHPPPILCCTLDSCPLSCGNTASHALLDIFEVRSEGIISALEGAALFGSVGQFKSFE